MKVFVDTNIIIDFYQKREEYFRPASVIIDLARRNLIQMACSATTFINAFFLLRKFYNKEDLYRALTELMNVCEITDVTRGMIENGLKSAWADFEDCVQCCSAELASCDVIVTRNVKDFAFSSIPAVSPEMFLQNNPF